MHMVYNNLSLVVCINIALCVHTGISIVVFSFYIIYNNVLLPNSLKGFLFFIQVTGTEVITCIFLLITY